jgi:hypothetical protein
VARGKKLFYSLHVARLILGLIKSLFVIIKTKPLHALKKSLNGLGRRTLKICIFNTKKELSACMTGEEPIVDCGANIADMNFARRRWGETNSYF